MATMNEHTAFCKDFDTKYNRYFNQLMEMKKADIIQEGITWGEWGNYQSTIDYMMKHYTKKDLAQELANKLTRREYRGY